MNHCERFITWFLSRFRQRISKISVFRPLCWSECWFVLVLHYKDVEKEQKKSTGLNLSVAFFELNRTIWLDFFAFLWSIFLVTFYILLSWNKENVLLNHHILIQNVWHRTNVSCLPKHQAKCVQLNAKTLQVLKNL